MSMFPADCTTWKPPVPHPGGGLGDEHSALEPSAICICSCCPWTPPNICPRDSSRPRAPCPLAPPEVVVTENRGNEPSLPKWPIPETSSVPRRVETPNATSPRSETSVAAPAAVAKIPHRAPAQPNMPENRNVISTIASTQQQSQAFTQPRPAKTRSTAGQDMTCRGAQMDKDAPAAGRATRRA